MHVCKEVQPGGREASVLWCLARVHGVTLSAKHHLISFGKELLRLPPSPYSHCCIEKSKTPFTTAVPKGPLRKRNPSQKRTYPGSAELKLRKGKNGSLSDSLT